VDQIELEEVVVSGLRGAGDRDDRAVPCHISSTSLYCVVSDR
jgi:hypothetical protein